MTKKKRFCASHFIKAQKGKVMEEPLVENNDLKISHNTSQDHNKTTSSYYSVFEYIAVVSLMVIILAIFIKNLIK